MQVEDAIFDYFGIIATQYEVSNDQYSKDVQFQTDKMMEQNKFAKDIIKTNKKDAELTDE